MNCFFVHFLGGSAGDVCSFPSILEFSELTDDFMFTDQTDVEVDS